MASPSGPWWSTPAARINGASSAWSVRIQASAATLEATGREAARQEYCCPADAEAAAAKLRALQSAYHGVTGDVEEHPTSGPRRPSAKPPRVVKALRYGRHVPLHEPSEVLARKRQEAACC